ncbi:NAD(P)-dependent alcohol dehydrogenase [Wenzhouxiangella sp. 15181]|uniref:NAD(P)-dependent alcohol dehydrogenase n=2 Tax=unclassified Wenzhouxiangella TaxID=2613841 RepID=UPI000E3271BF|nr:NAD(P)-dependent alcohol dehydrogenase [Wenzhouxiangella sp. 15181]RFF27287.1 NAD(P)-dependent alcohol dehydrogenase [Wenzhouxiangella sp. 15181]RFP69294.1 NAD(P)-dependent alcohol dehydrogenase [Wenzhouxiangella sp. 15190]
MKAWVYHDYGGPEQLQLGDVPTPVPKDDEVLIRVRSCALNDWDNELLRGDFINRLLNGLFRPKRMPILGSDIAGVVETAGAHVTRWKVGDEVYGDLSSNGFGGFAEYVCAPEEALERKPAKMSFKEAAAIPQAGMLAYQGLFDVGQLRPEHSLLINGAGGGVGSLGIHLARNAGIERATGVDSTEKLAFMKSLGFDEVIDYTQKDFATAGQQYDLILDCKTSRMPRAHASALKPGGTYCTIGGSVPKMLVQLVSSQPIRALTGKRLRLVALNPNKDLEAFNDLFESGKLTVSIDGDFGFDDIPDLFKKFRSGAYKGKLVAGY